MILCFYKSAGTNRDLLYLPSATSTPPMMFRPLLADVMFEGSTHLRAQVHLPLVTYTDWRPRVSFMQASPGGFFCTGWLSAKANILRGSQEAPCYHLWPHLRTNGIHFPVFYWLRLSPWSAGFEGKGNRFYPFNGSGKVLKEHVGPEILLFHFWKMQSVRRLFCILHLYVNYTRQHVNSSFFCMRGFCLNFTLFVFDRISNIHSKLMSMHYLWNRQKKKKNRCFLVFLKSSLTEKEEQAQD